MKGQAPSYWITAENLVRGLFDDMSDEHTLLKLASCNIIELHAGTKVWNSFLWLLVNHLRRDSVPILTGKDLGELRSRLPIVFH